MGRKRTTAAKPAGGRGGRKPAGGRGGKKPAATTSKSA